MNTPRLLFALLAGAALAAPAPDPMPPAGPFLRVAAVQLRSKPDVRANVARIKQILAECAAQRVQIVAFPECAVTGYFGDYILTVPADEIFSAGREIAAACREHHIAAVVGTPERRDGKMFNTALIINAQGEIVARYDKAQPVGQDRRWQCLPGPGPSPVFPVGPALASVIICHDNRFPELARLPVLAGSRVIFYISSEAILLKEQKMAGYRAQAQAIAVENRVYLVHANPPADDVRTGSHGQSRVVDTDGNIIKEAGIFQEEILVVDLDLSKATAEFALESLEGPLRDWWREGLKRVTVLK
jgi:predicted amidohydrolase